jgi:hypothetical protein
MGGEDEPLDVNYEDNIKSLFRTKYCVMAIHLFGARYYCRPELQLLYGCRGHGLKRIEHVVWSGPGILAINYSALSIFLPYPYICLNP